MANRNEQCSDELLSAALYYASRDWAVLPLWGIVHGVCECKKRKDCPTPGKHPRIMGGVHIATTDERKIRRWCKQWPNMNIGIATGKKSGIAVLDFDPRNGGMESMERLVQVHGKLPVDLRVATGGGGYHLYVAYPIQKIRKSSGEPGFDLQADGKYVVAPPSLHISGKRYEWTSDPLPLVVPELPPKWLEWIQVQGPCYTSYTSDTSYSSYSSDSSHSSERIDCEVAGGQASSVLPLREYVAEKLSSTLPTGISQRHKKIFRFLHLLKSHPDLKDEPVEAIRPFVEQWHEKALPFIGTKPFTDTWNEALLSWDRVDDRKWITEKLLNEELRGPMPPIINRLGYASDPITVALVCLCRGLQKYHGENPFFLSSRIAGERIGTDHMTASRRLKMLQADGVIELVSEGNLRYGQASEYFYTGDEIEENAPLPAGVGQ